MGIRTLDPKTGEVRELPAKDAEAEFRAGRAQIPVGSQLDLADEEGHVAGKFAADKLSEAIRDGVLHFADDGEIRKTEAENHPTQAALEGFVNDVTIPGVYDLAAQAAGADMQALAARRETTAGKLGSGAGIAGSFLIPGVDVLRAGGVGGKLAAKLLPSALAETAAQGVTKMAEKALSESLESTATRSIISNALGHATVGAGVGAMQALDEAALGNTDASVETILTGVGAGGLIGGTLGGALGALGGRVAREGRSVGAEAARAAESEGQLTAGQLTAALEAQGAEVDAAGMKKWFPVLMAKAANKSTGVAEEDVLKVMSPAGRKAVLEGERARDSAVKYTADLIDNLDANSAKFNLDEARLAPSVLNQLPPGMGDQAIVEARDTLREAREGLRGMVRSAQEYGLTAEQMATRLKPIAEQLSKSESSILQKVKGAKDVLAREAQVALPPADDVFEAGLAGYRAHLGGGAVQRELGEDAAIGQILKDLKLPKKARDRGLPVGLTDASIQSPDDIVAAIEEHWAPKAATIPGAWDEEKIKKVLGNNLANGAIRGKKAPVAKAALESVTAGNVAPMTTQELRKSVMDAVNKRLGVTAEGPEAKAVQMAHNTITDAKAAGLKKLGAGFARTVFDDAKGGVLKVAKNPEGLAQNLAEAELAGRSPILNQVIDYAPDHSWVRQAKVDAFDLGEEGKLADHLGIPDTENWLRELVDGKYKGPRTPQLDEFEARIRQLTDDVPELRADDLGKAAQWGLDDQGKLVLVDFGDRVKGAVTAEAKKQAFDPALDQLARAAIPVDDRAVKEIYKEMDSVHRILDAQGKKIKPLLGESKTISDVAGGIRARLQNEEKWGSAAKAHRELTEATEREAAARETLSAHFPMKGGKVDRGAVTSFTRTMDRVTGEPRVTALADWVDAQNHLADTARTHMDTSFSHRGQQLVKEYGEVYGKLKSDVLTLNAQDRLLRSNRAQGFIPGMALGSGLASLGLGPAGYAAGQAVGNAVMNPGRSARQIAAMLEFKRQVAQHITDRIGKILTGKGALKKLPAQAPRLVAAMIDGKPEERQKAFEEHQGELEQVMEPTSYINHISPQLAPIAEAMPEHSSAIAAQGQKTIAYLANQMPKPVSSLGPQRPFDFLNPPTKGHAFTDILGKGSSTRLAAKPSAEDIRRYGQVAAIATGGATALLDAIERGNLTAAQVRAFETLWPQQHADVQRQLVERLGEGGHKVSLKVKKSILLYLSSGNVDPGVRSFQQSIYAEEISQDAGIPSAGNLPTPNPRAPSMIGPMSPATDLTANFPFPR